MTRAHRRRLRPDEAERLAVGVLRQWRPGDTPRSIAERLGLPERRIREALDEPSRQVRTARGRGVTADELAGTLSLPRDFVVYEMKRGHAVRSARSAVEAGSTAEVASRNLDRLASRYRRQAGLSRRAARSEATRSIERKAEVRNHL
jgi:hypothetical protein